MYLRVATGLARPGKDSCLQIRWPGFTDWSSDASILPAELAITHHFCWGLCGFPYLGRPPCVLQGRLSGCSDGGGLPSRKSRHPVLLNWTRDGRMRCKTQRWPVYFSFALRVLVVGASPRRTRSMPAFRHRRLQISRYRQGRSEMTGGVDAYLSLSRPGSLSMALPPAAVAMGFAVQPHSSHAGGAVGTTFCRSGRGFWRLLEPTTDDRGPCLVASSLSPLFQFLPAAATTVRPCRCLSMELLKSLRG